MLRLMRRSAAVLAVCLLAGCGGQYVFTVGDQVAPAGGQAVVVMRLQKSEFGSIAPATKNACVRFKIEDGPLAAAYTDGRGYAAAGVAVPQTPGCYQVVCEHMDKDGREERAFAPVYVMDPRQAALAVDLDCLLDLGKDEAAAAQAALATISQKAYIIYFTAKRQEQAFLHAQLAVLKLPDGPVLQWQRQFWHTQKQGMLTRLVVEDRMVSQLPLLRQMLPNLKTGITNSKSAADTFLKADMKCISPGKESIFMPLGGNVVRIGWGQLAEKGL